MAGQTRVIKGGPGPAGEPFGKNGAESDKNIKKNAWIYAEKL